MSMLVHTTTLPEAVTFVQQGKVSKDDVLSWLEHNYVGLSNLFMLLKAGFDADEFAVITEVQSGLLAKQEAAQKALLARLDSDKPYASKTVCTITRKEFLENAQDIEVIINGVKHTASPKEFSTGSFGWNINGKVSVKVGGETVQCQLGMNLTVAKSKEAK